MQAQLILTTLDVNTMLPATVFCNEFIRKFIRTAHEGANHFSFNLVLVSVCIFVSIIITITIIMTTAMPSHSSYVILP